MFSDNFFIVFSRLFLGLLRAESITPVTHVECSFCGPFYGFWFYFSGYMPPCYHPGSPISSTCMRNICSLMILFHLPCTKKALRSDISKSFLLFAPVPSFCCFFQTSLFAFFHLLFYPINYLIYPLICGCILCRVLIE